MLLHHIASFCLYFSYIFGNAHEVGATIAFLHDLADIPGNLCKALNSTTYQSSSAVVFIVCMCVWFVTRIYCLPQMIYKIFTDLKMDAEFAQFQPFIYLNGIFLTVMCFLHYYWFLMFFKILSRYVVTGEAKDEQNSVEDSFKADKATTKTRSPAKKGSKAEKLE